MKQRTIIRLSLFCSFIVLVNTIKAQDTQIWLDQFTYFSYHEKWELELNPGVAFLAKENSWKDYYIQPTVSFQPARWSVTESCVEFHYINDPQAVDMIEVRPWIAQKLIFTPFIKWLHLEKPHFYVRYDYRMLYYYEDDYMEAKQRIRPRFGGRFILNNSSVVAKTFYIPFFYEHFIDLNGEAKERFATKDRFFSGIGYAFTNKFRCELDNYIVRARNTIDDEFTKNEVIIQLQIKYYLY